MYHMTLSGRPVALYLRSLTAGIVTAVLLVTSWTFIDGVRAGCATQNCLIPLGAQVSVAFSLSLIYAVLFTAICVPAWLTLETLGMPNGWSAALMGFTFPLTYWVATNLPGVSDVFDLFVSGLPYAVSGLVAALVCLATSKGLMRGTS